MGSATLVEISAVLEISSVVLTLCSKIFVVPSVVPLSANFSFSVFETSLVVTSLTFDWAGTVSVVKVVLVIAVEVGKSLVEASVILFSFFFGRFVKFP